MSNMNSGSGGPYHFALLPNFFKLEHSFAKALKPGTSYRLRVFKGIQKVQEMGQPFKAKIVGGRVGFDWAPLHFSLPTYNPTRNIEFTIKVMETPPNQPEIEIAHHRLRSGDFIRLFLNNSNSYSHLEVTLLAGLSLSFDLYTHSSPEKIEGILQEAEECFRKNGEWPSVSRRSSTTGWKDKSDILSDSDGSVSSFDSSNFASKKLARRRGHAGKLRSGGSNKDESESSSCRDFTPLTR